MKYYNKTERNTSPIIFTCEHASRTIPKKYSHLGLTLKDLRHSKDLWDPGSLDLAQSLASNLDASILYPNFSRLLIDANRTLTSQPKQKNTYHAPALKTELLIEDARGERLIPIPCNQMARPNREEAQRWNIYVKPYYHEIVSLAKQLLRVFDTIYIFQIHSFCPKYNGDVRKVDIGIIHDTSPVAKKFIHSLRALTPLHVGDNEPWGMKAVGGGLLKPLQEQKNISIIGIDVNNKYLKTASSACKIKQILTDAIISII